MLDLSTMQVPTAAELYDRWWGVRERAPDTNQAREMSLRCDKMLKAATKRRRELLPHAMVLWHLRRLIGHASEPYWEIILACIVPAEHQTPNAEIKNEPEEG